MFCTDFICRADKGCGNGNESFDMTRHPDNDSPFNTSRRVTDPNPPNASPNAGNNPTKTCALPELAGVRCRWAVIIVSLAGDQPCCDHRIQPQSGDYVIGPASR